MKELKREGWTFKLAYGASEEKNIPRYTSRCRLFWRTVGMTLIGWPLTGVFLAVFIIGGLFLAADRLDFNENTKQLFVPIKRWPSVRGHRVWPSMVILVGTILYYGPLIITSVYGYLSIVVGLLIAQAGTIGTAMASVATLILVIYLGWKIYRSDLWELFTDYLGDTVDGWCPTIEIQPPPQKEGGQ